MNGFVCSPDFRLHLDAGKFRWAQEQVKAATTIWRAAWCGLVLLCAATLQCLAAIPPPSTWDTFSDTWVATDALGRSLPVQTTVGPPRANKTVGIFYFLWLGQHGAQGPFDITKILAQDPNAINDPKHPLWGPMHVPHHWGESLFGYYIYDDEAVLRKHAQMLSDAGVDMVIFDVTNQLSYPESWQALCRAWDRVRREGNRAPQIAFLCPFGDPRKVARELWEQLYGKDLYPDLWYRWQGKPLMLADPALLGGGLSYSRHETPAELKPGHTLGQSIVVSKPFTGIGGSFPTWNKADTAVTLNLFRNGPGGEKLASRRIENVPDNGWSLLEFSPPLPAGAYYLQISEPRGPVGWWSTAKNSITNGQAFADGVPVAGDRDLNLQLADDAQAQIARFFTFRKPQPDYFTGPTGPNQWGWLEVYPQHLFTNSAGQVEQMTVGVAQNALDGKLSVLSNPRAHGRSFHAGQEPPAMDRDFTGRNFTEQWGRALAADPPFLFITGWNEWIAGRFDSKAPFYAPGPVTFVDQFNQEFSRDIEPMKGGHGDNYYYQMIANIRQYKGARPLSAVTPKPIKMDGRFDDWAQVTPEFRDTIGDPVHRDHADWGRKQRYTNQTGRNDIIAAKVSFDAQNLYFYVRTRAPLTPPTDLNWMLLFLDTDQNPTNGWLGYDFVVNRIGAKQGATMIEQNQGSYRWGNTKPAALRYAGNEMELSIPLPAVGGKLPPWIDFKWADNIQQTGDWSDFTLNGDAAPNDRFNYRAVLIPTNSR
jgi:hypothetical protein